MRRKRLIYEGLAHGIKLGYVLDESGTDGPKCHKRAVSRRKVRKRGRSKMRWRNEVGELVE